MAKILNSRQVQKHDIEENWKKLVDFIPLKGEMIVYDPDSSHPTSRQKIGDGITTINNLKFTNNLAGATYGFYIYSSDIANKKFKLSSIPRYEENGTENEERVWTLKDSELLAKWLETSGIYFDGQEISSSEGIGSQFIAYDIGISYTFFSKIDINNTDCPEGLLALDILPQYIDSDKKILLNDTSFEARLKEDKDFVAFAPLSPKAGSVLLYANQIQHSYGTAVGNAAVSFAGESDALGNYSFAAGRGNTAGYGAAAFGFQSIAYGNHTFVNGTNCEVGIDASNSHAEGHGSKVITGLAAHAEGHATQVGGVYQYENVNYNNSQNGNYCHAEGNGTKAVVKLSHAEGENTITLGIGSHAEGKESVTLSQGAHAEGYQTKAKGTFSHSEGEYSEAVGRASHAEGFSTYASQNAHAEGENTDARGQASHTEGSYSIANGKSSHAEGYETQTGGTVLNYSGTGDYAHAEGQQSYALGQSSHAEGQSFYDSSNKTTTELIASGTASHAEGQGTQAIGAGAHAEGFRTKASGNRSHAEGGNTTASGNYSHAEGSGTTASSTGAHAEGASTKASGSSSHAEGTGTVASQNNQHVEGRYNLEMSANYVHVVGNGQSNTARSNAHTLDWSGNAWFLGEVTVGKNKDKLITASDLGLQTSNNPYKYDLENQNAHLFENINTATGLYAFAQGEGVSAEGRASHAEGLTYKVIEEGQTEETIYETKAIGIGSHAEGHGTQAIGNGSHTEGFNNIVLGWRAHAEGANNLIYSGYSHVEGIGNVAGVEGDETTDNSENRAAHAEGCLTVAKARGAHSEGYGTIAASKYQHVEGKFNIEDSADKYLHIVGNGTDSENRSNAYALDKNGNGHFAGGISIKNNQEKIFNTSFVLELTYSDDPDNPKYIEIIGRELSLEEL